MLRYFVGFIATIALIVLIIVLIFHGGGKPKVQTTSRTLDSYAASGTEVSLTIDGPIVANQNHQAVKIIVARDSATFQQIQGYQGSVQKQQTYANNVDAYRNFLFAIERAGFTEGDNSPSVKDERGLCPLGDRFIYEIKDSSKQLERYWSTSCSGIPQSFKGNSNLIINLFQDQIPDYDKLSSGLNI